MKELLPYVIFDLFLIVLLPFLMMRRLSFWHPFTVYVFFHFYSFTWRAIGLVNGALPMYADNPNALAIQLSEFQRAMIWADVALGVFCMASFAAHLKFDRESWQPIRHRVFSKNTVLLICALALPSGFVALYAAKAQLVTSETLAESSYFQTMSIWPIGCIGLLVFLYGFRWYLVMMGLVYLGVVALQGYHRFMVILPLIFFSSYYLQSRQRRWPTLSIVVGALLMAMVFPRLKYIGRAYQNGDYGEVMSQIVSSFSESKSYEEVALGEEFLDQYAGSMTLVDEADKSYFGTTYLAIISLPIPRTWWPNKPGLADHLGEISTSVRQYSVEGRILTYLGEAYLNFGYFGLVLIPAILGYTLTLWCLRATSGPIRRFDRYLYTVFFMAFIQLFRDGMLSLFVFTIVHNIPMFFVWMLHLVPGVAPKVLDLPPSHPAAQEERPGIPVSGGRMRLR